jgi:condensin complex subunit 1
LTFCEAEKLAARDGNSARNSKDGEELDQVAGNAEDEIGDRIAGVRETEMLYGEDSLLAIYGPMLVHISGKPREFKVSNIASGWRALCTHLACLSYPESNPASGSYVVLQQVSLC